MKKKFKTLKKVKKDALSRVIRLAEAKKDVEVRQKYEAIFGVGRPIDALLASNQHLLGGMRSLASAAFAAHLEAHPHPVGYQVTQLGVTPGSNMEASVAEIRKAAKLYECAQVDVVAAVRFRPVPYEADAHGFGFSLELEALIFGERAEEKLRAKATTSRRLPMTTRSAMLWSQAGDPTAISNIRQMLKLDYTSALVTNLFDGPPPPLGWSKIRKRTLPIYIALMARAQLPISKMLVLHGAGGPVMAQALAEAKRTLKAACKGRQPVLHRDEVPHFLFAELRRLGLDDISVPIVKLN